VRPPRERPTACAHSPLLRLLSSGAPSFIIVFGFVKLDSVPLQVIRRSQELRCGHIRLRGCKRAWAFFDRETQTERIIRAVSNPYTTILGHMTGRQLLRRRGYEIDIEKVLVARAEHGVAIEINANPWRLDLDWRSHEAALRLGCVMSINPDRALNPRNRPHALGRGNDPQRRGSERQGLELPLQGRVVGLPEKAPGETSDQGRPSRRRMLRPPASSSDPKQADARKPRKSARR
jgi:hypothetical protein